MRMDLKEPALPNYKLDGATNIPLILAVEDDEDNQLLLKHALTMFGWQYIFATDAIAAIALAKERKPALILLDIVLPHISGLQIAAILKSHQQTRNIPLIAVTGLTREGEQDRIFAAGFNDYLAKPLNLNHLRQAIANNLRPFPYCEIARSNFNDKLLSW